MFRKELAFTLHQAVRNELPSIKRSHCHELIAAAFGFNSRASMDAQGMLTQSALLNDGEWDEYDSWDDTFDEEEPAQEYSEVDVNQLSTRLDALGLRTEHATRIADVISNLLREPQIVFADYGSLWHEDAREHIIERAKTHPNAAYALACFNECSMPPSSEAYWYNQRRQGIELNTTQIEFADEYGEAFEQANLYQSLLKKAAQLGHADAAYVMADVVESEEEHESWLRKAANLGSVQAQSHLAIHYEESKWLECAANQGDFSCLDTLARQAFEQPNSESLIEGYKWVKLAKLYGHDLTRSIADNDEDYGPVFVLHEGIHLPKATKAQIDQAARDATETYKQYSTDLD
ncbi:hypothetical protein Fbal_2436 [Ferrimonas balearica DSM 9799]|uniref:Sel1 domain protein repeat-containing protein n=1 Tax=Ferrimonas balearica (strain DSM 9799 / CCM 4581 / KCTC 23876 / PAT) TaxID=550540 RepID=E1SMW9_FERBD|nr:hypothetical protein [Ferrimonas balearica]ADN76638.1 hypothetical protein Fbal_2436 [Ferrimonas balearica DSM 9799]